MALSSLPHHKVFMIGYSIKVLTITSLRAVPHHRALLPRLIGHLEIWNVFSLERILLNFMRREWCAVPPGRSSCVVRCIEERILKHKLCCANPDLKNMVLPKLRVINYV